MRRTVACTLTADVGAPARLAFQVGIADPQAYETDETTSVAVGGTQLPVTELAMPTGGRTWVVEAPPGELCCRYTATVTGIARPAPVELSELLLYLRPSRYCESDRMAGFAGRLFHDIHQPRDVLAAVSSWVGTQLDYVSGSSGPTDGAVETLLAGKGVCRDFAHLAVALLRAKEIPARVVAVYAPGLDPMDFHAVAEAFVDGAWYVVDGTLLAPRSSLVRIATGRDAADTSFLTSHGGQVTLTHIAVTAIADDGLPDDNVADLVQLT